MSLTPFFIRKETMMRLLQKYMNILFCHSELSEESVFSHRIYQKLTLHFVQGDIWRLLQEPMMKKFLYSMLIISSMVSWSNAETASQISGQDLYQQNCSFCHHPERYGISGPPLIAETIGKRKDTELTEIIKNGLPATNMPSFKTSLKDGEIAAIVSYIKTPAVSPKWETEDMLTTRAISDREGLSPRPKPDMTNFFMVVEGGKGDVHFMDGDTFTLLDRAHVGAIHGGPKFDNNLKNAYLGGRDGWVVKYDLTEWREVGRLRAGINTRNMAVSSDGKILAVANTLPENIVLINTETLEPTRIINLEGKVGAIYTLKSKEVFVISFRDRPEVWFLEWNSLIISKFQVDQPFSDFFIEPGERFLIGTSREGKHLSILDLESRKITKCLEGEGMPHLASSAIYKDDGKMYAAFPHIEATTLTVMELYKWSVIENVKLKGAGFFARTHDNINTIWVDTGSDTIQIVDRKTLKIVNEVVPSAGKKAMHIEFTKDGKYALVSIWEIDGAIVVYDTTTLKEVKRLPFVRPVGKYNATNKKY